MDKYLTTLFGQVLLAFGFHTMMGLWGSFVSISIALGWSWLSQILVGVAVTTSLIRCFTASFWGLAILPYNSSVLLPPAIPVKIGYRLISLIFEQCPDRVILSIKIKPNILQKTLFHRFSPKFIKVEHGHNFFWPLTSWRPLEAKNTPQRPKWHEGVILLKKDFNESCSATSKPHNRSNQIWATISG